VGFVVNKMAPNNGFSSLVFYLLTIPKQILKIHRLALINWYSCELGDELAGYIKEGNFLSDY